MKNISYLLMTPLALALFVGGAGGACSSSGGTTGTGGSTGKDGGGGAGADPLVSSDTGFVDDVTTGVVGAWYAYGDSAGNGANATSTDFSNSHCQMGGFTADQCSIIVSPTPGKPFPPTDMATSQMCTNGTAAKVINKTGASTPDYSDLFGAGIGLDFNNPGGDAGAKGSKDLSAYSGVEFDFSGTLIPNNAMRVNFPFDGEHAGNDSPYWMGATNDSSPLKAGHIVVNFSDVGGPKYLAGQTPVVNPADYPFNTMKVQSIQFQVFTVTSSSTPYNFCVANLALIPKSP
jgi:hypothetical protein